MIWQPESGPRQMRYAAKMASKRHFQVVVLFARSGLVALVCLLALQLFTVDRSFAAGQVRAGKSYGFAPGAITVSQPGAAGAEHSTLIYSANPAVATSPAGLGEGGGATGSSLDDYDEIPVASIADPLEPWNRFWFGFNDIVYLYAARPLYRAWEFITPADVRSGLNNFLSNLLFPVRFANNLLQFRFKEAGVEFGRFIINTTCSLGFANVAKDKKTIVPVDPTGEDFGQTLGYWGAGHGFYLVLPLLGPSSLRDAIGRVGDFFAQPTLYLETPVAFWAINGGLRFNSFGNMLPTYLDMKAAAVDPYLSMREAYVNLRAKQVSQ